MFIYSATAIQVHLEATERRILLRSCERVVEDFLRVLAVRRGDPRMDILQLYDENGELTGITGELGGLRELLQDHISWERFVQATITVALLGLVGLFSATVVTGPLAAAGTTALALLLYGAISALWGWGRSRGRVRWKFDES